jgi:branched-chain amino acid transport system substrate-binding protein
MTTVRRASKSMVATAAAAAVTLLAAACGGGGSTSGASGSGGGGGSSAAAGGGSGEPVKVGFVYCKTGSLAEYGAEEREGFKVGLNYATHGSNAIAGHPVKVDYVDGACDPAKATSAAKTLIGKGYKIIAGPTNSGVAKQLASVAAKNKVLYISGPAATDEITGANDYTFRSGRETYQDVKTAAAVLGNVSGKKVLVFAQDYAFGKANVTAVKAVLGGAGANVESLLVPTSAKDFTPFAQKIKQQKPDLLFVAWAGSSTAAMWQTLAQQGVFQTTTAVTGLGNTASYPDYSAAGKKLKFLAYYFAQAPDNKVNKAMVKAIKKDGKTPDIFSPDGFVAAQMVTHAVTKAGGDSDVDKMVSALEGWTFTAPKGKETVRSQDHAMIQPMYVAKLTKQGGKYVPKLVKTVPAKKVAPPVSSGK